MQEIIQKNLKTKSDNYCVVCTDQESLQKVNFKDKINLKDPKKTWL